MEGYMGACDMCCTGAFIVKIQDDERYCEECSHILVGNAWIDEEGVVAIIEEVGEMGVLLSVCGEDDLRELTTEEFLEYYEWEGEDE